MSKNIVLQKMYANFLNNYILAEFICSQKL